MKRIAIITICVLLSCTMYSEDNKRIMFDFPIYPGDTNWGKYADTQERLKALQIPDSLLSVIPTQELTQICLKFPFVQDFLYFQDYQDGFTNVISKFNGLRELLKREDVIPVLLAINSKLYEESQAVVNNTFKHDLDLKKLIIPFLFLQDEIYNKASETDKNAILKYLDNSLAISGSISEQFEDVLLYVDNSLKIKAGIAPKEPRRDYINGYELTTTLTPNNTVVPDCAIYHGVDLSVEEQQQDSASIKTNYPNNVIIGPASKKYNCHGYAWHTYPNPNSDYLWIGFYTSGEVYHYWEDGSYIPVPEAIATHVKYGGDHSAIRINSNTYVSKWNKWSLVQHAPNDSPYGSPYSYYRIAPSMSGNNRICYGVESYSIINMPPSSTIQWTVTGSYFTILSGQGTPNVQVQALLPGLKTLTATIQYNGTTISTLTKRIWCGAMPSIGLGINYYAPNGEQGIWTSSSPILGTYNTFTIEDDQSSLYYDRVEAELYRLDNNLNPSILVQSWNSISTTNAHMPFLPIGWYYFQLRGVNEFGYSEWDGQEVEVVDYGSLDFGIEYDRISETLTIKSRDHGDAALRSSYEIQLWSISQLKKRDSTNQPTYVMSLSQMPSGIYMVKIIKDGKTFSRKFSKF